MQIRNLPLPCGIFVNGDHLAFGDPSVYWKLLERPQKDIGSSNETTAKRMPLATISDESWLLCMVPLPAEPVHRRIFLVLDAFSCLHVGIITNNCTKINDKCKIIAIATPRNVKRPLAGSLPKWYNTDA